MADNQIVTEIIIDADQAELSLAQLAAAQRAAQREFDKTTAKIMENTAATQRAAEAGIDVADSLTITAGALRKARTDSDAYLGRMDPLIFAHTSLTRELGKVGQAIKGVDTLLIAKKIHDDEAIARVAQLEMREKELAAVMAQLEAGTMDAAEAMVFMKTATERLESSIKPVITNIDALRAKLVPLEAAQKAWAVSVAEINTALAENNITLAEAALARERLIKTTDMSVRGMTEEEAAMAAHVAMLQKLIASQAAYNQLRTGVSVNPFAQSSNASINAGPTISNPLYGADREKRQRELEQTFAELDQLEAKYNPLTAALQKYQNEMAEVISDHAKLGSSAAVVEAELSKVAAAYYANVKAINEMGDAKVDLDALRASIDPLYAATQKYNKEIDRLLAAEKLLPGSSDIVTAAIRRTTMAYDAEVEAIRKRDAAGGGTSGPTPEELNAQRAGFDRLFAAEQAYKNKLAEIAMWEKNVADGTAVANAARAEALAGYNKQVDAINGVSRAHVEHKKRVDDGTVSVGQMKFATQQLTVQTSQLISGIATGQPILMTLIQQGHQIIDVAISSGTGFSILGVVFKAIMSPIGLFISGLVTVVSSLALLISSSETAARRLTGLRNEISLVSDDYKNLASVATQAANDIAKNTFTSTADARAASKAIVTTPGFEGGAKEIETIIDAFARLSAAQGKAELDMAQLGQALKDPVAFLDEMQKTLKGVDANLVDHARLLALGGDKAAAFALALKAVQEAGKPLERTNWQRAVEDLGKAFTATGQSGQQAFDGIGTAASNMGAAIIKGVAMSVQALRDLNDWAQKTGGPALYGSWWPGGPAGGNLPAGMRPTTTYGGTADTSLTQVARALLDVIAGPESGGRYNVRYGGAAGPQTFDSYASHPQVAVRIPGTNTTSDAAGRYQFLSSTYQPIAADLGLTGFSPAEQDKAAWALAQSTYKKVTGRDLNADLLAGRTAGIPAALKEVWPSMPGGGQQGITLPEFTNALNARLRAMGGKDPEGGPTTVFSAAGMANQTKHIIDMANALAAGTPEKQAEALGKSLQLINNALVVDPKNEAYLQMRTDLTKRISEAIPETDKLVNSIKESIDADSRQRDAWGKGNDAAIIQANANKARAEALRLVGKDSADLIPLQARLTALYNEQTRAAELANAAQAQGTPERRVEALNRELEATKELLKLDPNNVALKQQQTELTRAIYETVPAFDAQVRKIKEDIDANSRMSLAWAHGSEAAAIQANREKALIEVRAKFGPVTDERIAAEAMINKLYDEQLESVRKLEAQQAAGTPARQSEELVTKLKYAQDAAKADPNNVALAQQVQRLTKEVYDSVPAIDAQVRAIKEDIDANTRLADAWDKGAVAASRMVIENKAIAEANKLYAADSPDAIKAAAALTIEYRKQAEALQTVEGMKEKTTNAKTIDMIKAETAAMHMQADVGALYVQHKKDALDIEEKYFEKSPEFRAERLKERDTIALMNQELSNQRAIGQYLAGQFDTIFSTIGTAITNAFTQGQGAAVNWGNVTKAVITQVQQALIQLAVINPIKQALFGSSIASAPTLSNVMGFLGGGSGASGAAGSTGGGSGGSLLSLFSSAGSAASSGSSLMKMFTGKSLTDSIGLFDTTGFLGSSGTMANLLATPVWGSVSGAATNTALAGMGGQFGPATASAYTAAGGAIPTTIGTLAGAAGGVAAGFGLGTMAGQGIQGMRGTTGPSPMIGAATGAIAGAIIGTVVPVIGTMIGAVIGGIIGGGAGGLIGPKKASPYSSTLIDITGGRASLGDTLGQGVDTVAERASILDDITKLNAYLDGTNLKLTGLGKVAQIGQNSPGGFQDPSKFGNITAGFSELRFGSANDATLDKYLKDKSFTDSAALDAMFKDYRNLVDNTIPGLMAFGKTTGSVNDAIKELNDAFNAGIAKAKEYGIATEDLAKAQADGEKKIRDQADETIKSVDFQFRMRKRIAEGGDPQSIELDNFDQGAREQREAFKQQMVGLFGEAFTSTTYYADQMKLLEETLGAERAAIVKKYADLILQQEKQIRQINENLDVRAMNASGASAQDKALFSFDVRARQERESFSDSLIGIYGESYRTTKAYADEMKRLETVQGAERVQIVKQYADALVEAERGLARGDQALKVRLMNATPGVADLDKRLFAFDVNAQNEREDFSRNLLNIYGDAYATTAAYANRVALLEQVLGAERLQIVTESNDAILQKTKDAQTNAANAIQSLVAYATGLQTSDASPLSPQDKLTLSRNRFNAVSGAAAAGDYNSIQQLSGYADTFLSASREVYGSGAAYVGDFQRVLDVLGQVADVAPDTLTASVLATETRTQTAELVQELQNLKAAVDTVTTQLRQNQTAPARIAA